PKRCPIDELVLHSLRAYPRLACSWISYDRDYPQASPRVQEHHDHFQPNPIHKL
ncbi:hypothetical protein BGZ92_006223, partial [Podila epicladia]